jgi:hypothetical protein
MALAFLFVSQVYIAKEIWFSLTRKYVQKKNNNLIRNRLNFISAETYKKQNRVILVIYLLFTTGKNYNYKNKNVLVN